MKKTLKPHQLTHQKYIYIKSNVGQQGHFSTERHRAPPRHVAIEVNVGEKRDREDTSILVWSEFAHGSHLTEREAGKCGEVYGASNDHCLI